MEPHSPHHPHHQVVITDDCADFREALTCLLTLHDVEVVSAASGRELFERFAGGVRPCMMLLDLRMPDMDGWEVWKRMQADVELRNTPVVILSGEIPDATRARAVGIRAFLQKPAAAGDVVDAVERYCGALKNGSAQPEPDTCQASWMGGERLEASPDPLRAPERATGHQTSTTRYAGTTRALRR